MICQWFKGLSKIEGFTFELLVIQEAQWNVYIVAHLNHELNSYRRKNTYYLCSCLYFPVNFIINITTV